MLSFWFQDMVQYCRYFFLGGVGGGGGGGVDKTWGQFESHIK